EYEIGISGKAGNINGKIDPRGNIFEGPRKREYPMPPLRGTDFTERMAGAARKLGWNAFPGPAAVNSQAYQNRPGCGDHGVCPGGGRGRGKSSFGRRSPARRRSIPRRTRPGGGGVTRGSPRGPAASQRKEFDGGVDDPQGAGDWSPQGRHASPRHQHLS